MESYFTCFIVLIMESNNNDINVGDTAIHKMNLQEIDLSSVQIEPFYDSESIPDKNVDILPDTFQDEDVK